MTSNKAIASPTPNLLSTRNPPMLLTVPRCVYQNRPLLVALIFALLHTSHAASVSPRYYTHVWQRETGLPQNTVTSIVQTRDGYLWVGTYSGLARFDGVRFVRFESNNTPAMRSSRVTSLFESPDGYLWIGHEGG